LITIPPSSYVHIYTDSKSLIDKYNAIQNYSRYFYFARLAIADHYSNLWHAVFSVIKHSQLIDTLHKVKTHANNDLNNYTDHLTKQTCNLSYQLTLLPSTSFLTVFSLYNYTHIDSPMRPFLKQIT